MAKLDHSLIRQTWTLMRQGLTHEAIGEEVGRATRTIDDYLSPKWLGLRGLGHLSYASDEPAQVPMSRLENEAWSSCKRQDHDGMTFQRYEGHAFRTVEILRIENSMLEAHYGVSI